MVLVVKVGESGQESVGDTVLGVKVDSLLYCVVTNHVSVSKVLCNDAASWLLFLCNLIGITLLVGGEVTSVIVGGAGGACNLNLCGTKGGVVKQECGLSCGFLFEGDGCLLCLASRGDVDVGDLSAGNELAVA